jgi:hypothetical protein
MQAESDICRLIAMSDLRRSMSDIDYATYAKATTPAMEPVDLTVEQEALGLARQIKATHGGERQYNVGKVAAEIQTLERNQANGYSGWEFRLAVLRRTVALVGGTY